MDLIYYLFDFCDYKLCIAYQCANDKKIEFSVVNRFKVPLCLVIRAILYIGPSSISFLNSCLTSSMSSSSEINGVTDRRV